MKRNQSSFWLVGLFFVLVVSVVPLVNLLQPGLPLTHDGQDHVARIANFYQSLVEGNIVPRWAGNLNWGYGHPVMMFLYPLPSYLASLFHVLGFSLVDSVKLVFGIFYIASLVTMYFWSATVWGPMSGVAAAVLYGFAPYRFVDLYVRGALGEHVAFVFLPLILLGLWYLAQNPADRRGGPLVVLSTAAFILSHNAISLMFLPIVALYLGYLLWGETKKKTNFLVLSVWYLGLGFLTSAFFWLPAFFEGKYTLRDIVTKGEFSERFVPLSWFWYSPWNYGGGNQFTKALGLAQWLALGSGLLALVIPSLKVPKRPLTVGVLGILAVSLFLMTTTSEFIWEKVTILQKFQFPWRLMSIAVFVPAVLAAVVLSAFSKKNILLVASLLSFIAIVGTFQMWHAQAYQLYPETYFTGIYEGTTDTGESSPIWSVRFMERRPSASIEVIEGKVEVEPISRNSTKHIYQVSAVNKSRLVENTLYFPGWRVFIDGVETSVEFQDPNYRGLMTFWVEPGIHEVLVQFKNTKLRSVANSISIIGAILFFGFIGTIKLWQKRLSR